MFNNEEKIIKSNKFTTKKDNPKRNQIANKKDINKNLF
jgi:hypothetical protein